MNCTRVQKFLPLYVADDLAGRRRNRAVEKHLSACEVCRRAAAEYHASRELFRADTLAPDFDGAFYEEIRNSVLARIRRDHTIIAPPRRLSNLFDARLAYAASLALLLVFAALSLHTDTPRTSVEGGRQKMSAYAERERPTTPATIETPQAASPESNDRATPRPSTESARGTTSREPRAAKSLPPQPNADIESARNEARPGSTSTRRTPSHAGRNPHAPTAAARANAEESAAAASASGGATATPSEVSRVEIQTSDPNIRIIWLSPDTQDTARPLK